MPRNTNQQHFLGLNFLGLVASLADRTPSLNLPRGIEVSQKQFPVAIRRSESCDSKKGKYREH